jgi:hypothetical protein
VNEWGRRFGCLLLLLLWLIIMSLPLLTVVLVRQGQIQVGRPESSQVRLFLLQERQVEGVGLEWSRPRRQEPGCRQTSVIYFMWRGQGENVRFVTCPAAVNPAVPGTGPAGFVPAGIVPALSRGHCARALIQLLTGDRGRPHAAFLAVSSNYGQGGSGGRDLVYSPRSPFRLSRPGDGRKRARRRGDKAAKAGIRLAQGNAARSCPHRNVCMIGIAATQHLFC